MTCRGPWPLWIWVLWGLWMLSESDSISHAADSTSTELPSDLGMCQAFPTTAATRPEHPSPIGQTIASAGRQGSGILVPEVTTRGLVPAGSSDEQEGPPSPAAVLGGPVMPGSFQAGVRAGISSPGTASHPSSAPPAPTTAWLKQFPSFTPMRHVVGAVTVEAMRETAWTAVPSLPQNEHSTGTSHSSISKGSAEPQETALLLSQKVVLGLDEDISLSTTAASISQDRGSPMKMAAASANPATGPPRISTSAATEGARMASPPSEDPPSASLGKVTFSAATIGKATELGTRALSDTGHSASQEPPVPPAQLPPSLLSYLPGDAVLGTGEKLPPSHSAAPSTAVDGLPGANAVIHLQATALAPGTLPMVTDVIAEERIPTVSFLAPESTSAELVSIRNEDSTKTAADIAFLETKATPEGLSMSLSPHAALTDPDGPSPRPFLHSMDSAFPQTLSAGPWTTTAEVIASGTPPTRPSMAMPLSLTGASGAKPERVPRAAATPSITAYGLGTVPAAHPSSLVGNTPVSEAGMGTASLDSGSATTMLGDTGATLSVPDAPPSHSQPGPTVGSATPESGVIPRPAPTPPLWTGAQHGDASKTEMWSPNTAPGTGTAVPGSLGVLKAVTVHMASQADISHLLEGNANVGMALGVPPSSILQEMPAVTSPLSLATSPPAMGASSDPHLDGSTTGRAMGMEFLEVGMEGNPDASAAGPASRRVTITVRPSPEPRAQGSDASETRPSVDLTLLAPKGSRLAPLVMTNPSQAPTKARPFPHTATGETPPPVTPPTPKNAAAEEGQGTSQLAGDGSTTQAALDSTLAENTRVSTTTSTHRSGDMSSGTAPLSSLHTTASIATWRPAAPLHRYHTAEPTSDMGMNLDTASSMVRNEAARLPLELPTPMAGVTEPAASNASPSTRSAPDSKSPLAMAIMGLVSPTATELAIPPSPGLAHSTAEPDVSVSTAVPRSTHLMMVSPSDTPSITVTGPAAGAGDVIMDGVTTPTSAVLSSASAPHSPHVTLSLPPEATDSMHNPVLRTFNPVTGDEPTVGVTSLSVGPRETTVASWSGAEGTTAREDTTPSEKGNKGAAPSASTSTTHVPDSNTAGSSLATTLATSIFPSNTVPPATSVGWETFEVTKATTTMPFATARDTSTSSALSLTVIHETSGDGHVFPARTPSPETTAGSWGTLGPSAAVVVPSSPLPSLNSPPEETTTTPSSLLVVGTAGKAAAVQAPTEPITGTTSTSVSNYNMGQAVSTSLPAFQTSPGAPAWGKKTAITTGNTMAITAGSTSATTAGNTVAITAGNSMAVTTGSTRAISTTPITAGSTVAIASTAPVTPAKEVGGFPAPGTTALVRPPATTSPATSSSSAFGTQTGPAAALSTSAHTTASLRNPAPEPQPTHELIMPAVSLYPFGIKEGDQEYVRRMVDFNSPLFKPEIGFPFGKSLRDTLYFTDNGQIIFPPTDNYVPSNPNPPPRGFSGRESLPMVAAFWDDADFSQGIGTTWYQEYSTLSSTRDRFVQDVEAKIEKYQKIPYVAKWTLKVTWEKALAYPSQRDDSQTSTYQAVLTTDGNYSFALLLYQDGGMRWDYTKLAAGNVLIGFSSGSGYAQNSALTQKPPSVKYRPDQHSSAGSDVRGLWIYRLDSRSRVNYRLWCLAWLDAEPAPATWNSQLPPCPCSQPQAELDPRYRWSKGPVNTPVRMLRTASPSPAGAGVRCLYQDGSFLEGWQERAWNLPIHRTTDRELEAFNWCCRRVGKPQFCSRFAEKRPRVSCEGYIPPTPAGAFGDPHITTLDGHTYTFNGLGDFVLLVADDAQTTFMLQGRTAQTGTAKATNFVAFAAQYIISTTTTTVEWTLESQGDIQVLLNNETIQFSYSQDMGAEVYYSPGVLLINASSVTAVFNGTIAVSISATSGILSMVCSLPAWYRNNTKGLLGTPGSKLNTGQHWTGGQTWHEGLHPSGDAPPGVWDYDPADDFQMPNGTSIPVNSSEEEIYSYGMTWAVGGHSLFAQPLDSPALNFTPIFLSRLQQENESQYQLAVSQCHSNKECIYDSLSTGNLALGLATQSLAADFQHRKTVLNAFPPVIVGDASLTAFRTEKVRKQYYAMGMGAHFVPYLSPELNISENGTLMWEPHGIVPFTINLEAVGSNNLSALLQLRFTLCKCSKSQECDYSNTVILKESSLQLAACRCEGGYSGPFCQDPPDPCSQGCFPGVGCDVDTGCGPCPAGLTGDGRHCSDIDECAQGMECPENTTCTNTVGSYICSCPASEEGERPGCSSSCRSHSCPKGYCSNGGRCHLHPITCTPTCACPSAFTDQRCLVAGGDFQPLPSTDLPQRSIQLRVRTLQNATAEEINSTVSAILGSLEIKAFQNNSNITQTTDSEGFTFVVVSEFAYDSRSTVIQFLNEKLTVAITSAFNRRRGRREAGTGLLFQRLYQDNITDLVKLTVAELRDYFPCALYGYKGYRLHYVETTGFVCISPCKMGYCQHGGRCQHLPEGPTCSCLPFSIYSPAGARCEWLAISLAAFLGILLGALALLCLLFAIACLALHLCRQYRQQHKGTKETFWRTRPFSSLTMAGEQAEPTYSHSLERHWKPQLQAIDPSVQIRIQRPHLRPPSQFPQQP
ncbi:mucin-4 isoform X2 [Pithys albifrons albifrons]|uniref:mucin-4 isoform X2 n=1 Tax=Pithys albifrons albifrons TaxID=3385563 RepID=UPI003A5CCEAA